METTSFQPPKVYQLPREMDARIQPAEAMSHERYHYAEMAANNG